MFGAAPFGSAPFAALSGPTSTGYSATLDTGFYTLSGQSLTVRVARIRQLAQGSYTLTGQSIDAVRGKSATLETGFYTLSGQSLGTRVTLSAQLAQGAYVLTGQSVTATLTKVPHHYRVHEDNGPQYMADLAIEPLYQLTDDFSPRYRVSDIAEES